MDGQEVIIRVTALEQKTAEFGTMSGKVAAVSEKVDGLEKTLYREVDGLREQQKAHKDETSLRIKETQQVMAKGFEDIGEKVDSVTLVLERRKGNSDLLTHIGQCIVGLAVIAEAVKVVLPHI